ncbi:MAG: protein-L-isoaspartate O-methyltransferase [Sphingomonadales bacterium]|jgi:protein-L-isoaspartate(D-aspartate) O-methyltransferase
MTADQRQTMIDSQLKTVGITDAGVLAGFAAVDRSRFVADAATAYADMAQPLAPGRHLLPPMTLALLLQAAAARRGERALVVGAGSGYSAALLASMGLAVTALESDAALLAMAEAAGVPVVNGPLAEGWAAQAPYDLVLFEGSIEWVPPALIMQLAPGGRVAAVFRDRLVGHAYAGPVTADGQPAGLPFIEVAAAPLPGFARPRAFAF